MQYMLSFYHAEDIADRDDQRAPLISRAGKPMPVLCTKRVWW